MSDRTETLLSELIELTKRQLAYQEEALAGQRTSIEAQRQSIAAQMDWLQRQRRALRILFVLFAVVFVFGLAAPFANYFIAAFTRR